MDFCQLMFDRCARCPHRRKQYVSHQPGMSRSSSKVMGCSGNSFVEMASIDTATKKCTEKCIEKCIELTDLTIVDRVRPPHPFPWEYRV